MVGGSHADEGGIVEMAVHDYYGAEKRGRRNIHHVRFMKAKCSAPMWPQK